MRSPSILIICAMIMLFSFAMADVPNPENWHIIYGNRDGTPMSVELGSTIDVPVWGATDPLDQFDSVTVMHNPLKSWNMIVPQRLEGGCVYCQDTCSFTEPYHSSDSISQGMLFVAYLQDPDDLSCYFATNGDTVQIGYFTMSLTNNPAYLGQIVCPFAEGFDPRNHTLTWGMQDGLTTIKPIATYGCLYFSTCDAVAGDANGDNVIDALDVTFSVNYFKGRCAPPRSWNCPGHGQIFVGADSNGDCQFDGLDVTYSVNYLKGRGPAPRKCPSC